MRQNKLGDAVESLRKAIDLNPKMAKFHYALGSAYNLTSQKAHAIDEYLLAIKNDMSLLQAYK